MQCRDIFCWERYLHSTYKCPPSVDKGCLNVIYFVEYAVPRGLFSTMQRSSTVGNAMQHRAHMDGYSRMLGLVHNSTKDTIFEDIH